MDGQSVFIAMLVGGIGAGAGAAIGALLAKFLPGHWKIVSVSALTVLGMSCGTLATDAYKNMKFQSEVREHTAETSAMMRFLAEHYPDEFQAYLKKLNRRMSSERAREAGAKFTAELLKSNVQYAKSADDQLLQNYLLEIANLYELVFSVSGEDACHSVIMQGRYSEAFVDKHFDQIERVALALFKALADGKASGREEYAVVTDAQREEFRKALLSETVSSAEWAWLAAPPAAPVPGYCDAMRKFLTGLAEYEGDGAASLRSDMTVRFAGA